MPPEPRGGDGTMALPWHQGSVHWGWDTQLCSQPPLCANDPLPLVARTRVQMWYCAFGHRPYGLCAGRLLSRVSSQTAGHLRVQSCGRRHMGCGRRHTSGWPRPQHLCCPETQATHQVVLLTVRQLYDMTYFKPGNSSDTLICTFTRARITRSRAL